MSYAPAPGGTPLRTLSRREAGRARRPVRPRHAALNLAMGTEPASEPATSPGDHGHLGARGFRVSVEDPSPRWDRGDCPRVCVHSVEEMTHLVWKPRPLCVLGGNTGAAGTWRPHRRSTWKHARVFAQRPRRPEVGRNDPNVPAPPPTASALGVYPLCGA